ncbi:hypothetical protein ACIG5C_25345 [Streptomyces werraensis]|uniref:hypothetical protein n=1 Tax=Streptomyces werraensis TaxID=68284 RepID=UPI0037D92330
MDEEDRLVGIVTRGDLPRAVLRTDGGIERAVRRDALGTTHRPPPRAVRRGGRGRRGAPHRTAGAAHRRRHGGAGGESYTGT